MKKLFYLLPIIAIMFLSSCSKKADVNPNGNNTNLDPNLIGTWMYEEFLDISTDLIILLDFNKDGSGQETIIHKRISTGIKTVQSATTFNWNSNITNGELKFIINGNEQAASYNFNNNLRISIYSTLKPNFIKQ